MSDNAFSGEEVVHVLHRLGVGHVHHRSNSIRCACPIHQGDNEMGFAGWRDQYGIYRFTCHTRHCVAASSLEWVVRRVQQGSINDAIHFISQQTGRTDLFVSDFNRSKELAIQEDANPQVMFSGDEEEIERLRKVHPFHAYWRDRGYTPEMCADYELTFRSLDYRAIIPMRDSEGHLLGTMERSTTGAEPKYKWNSPNPNKGSFLYGIPQALRRPLFMGGRRVVFLVEGTLDGMKAAAHGFPVVASQTNRLSAAQAQTLLSHWDLVICLPDNDLAGENLIVDLNKRVVPFMDTAVFTIPEQFKDMDEIPQPLIPSVLNPALFKWRESFHQQNRQQRSRLLQLAF